MWILFNDLIQNSDAAEALKSPALSETFGLGGATELGGGWRQFTINMAAPVFINAVGIGNTDGTGFNINGRTVDFTGNGLYMLPNPVTETGIQIITNATYIGRLGMGRAVRIGTTVRKEPAFCSTAESRMTLSGQVISGLGGYNYRTVSLDSRYQIDETIMKEIEAGYKFTGMGYPFFVNFEDEAYKLPFDRLYAVDTNSQRFSFESGVKRFLYSRRFDFRECF